MDPYTVVVADTTGVIRAWDTGAEELFGHSARDAVGASLDLIVPDAYREMHWTAFRALMSGAAPDEPSDRGTVVVPVTCADGTQRRTAVRLMLVRDPWGRPVAAAAAFMPPEAAPDGVEPLPEL